VSKRRRRNTRCRVEELEGRAVPSITIVKAALDVRSDTIHIIGYIEKTSVAGLTLRVNVTLEAGKAVQDFVIEPPNTHITALHTSHPPALPPGVKARAITGIFDTKHALPDGIARDDIIYVDVKVELLHKNETVAESATKAQTSLEILTGKPPYLA
jgi:hypothetical protein